MSEEIKQEETTVKEKKCKCTLLAIGVIISLLFSVASLTMSIMNFTSGSAPKEEANNNGGNHNKIVISEKYDRGQSYGKAKLTNKPIIAFFYTDWCGFCQKFAPTFDKVAKDKKIKDKYAIAYVNCEKPENQDIVKEYGIQGFPTVYVIKGKNKTQLDNNTFFSNDSKQILIERLLDIFEN